MHADHLRPAAEPRIGWGAGERAYPVVTMTEPDEHRPSLMPILTALAVVGIVVVVAVLLWAIRGEDRRNEAGIGRAVVGQNDALQREDYADFRSFTCEAQQGNESQVLADQRQSRSAKGPRYVDDVTGITVDAEQATATVTYHFEKAEDAPVSVSMTFARENGEWKVCSAGPR